MFIKMKLEFQQLPILTQSRVTEKRGRNILNLGQGPMTIRPEEPHQEAKQVDLEISPNKIWRKLDLKCKDKNFKPNCRSIYNMFNEKTVKSN